jgi:flagellar basal-body rod modification protein FlgD
MADSITSTAATSLNTDTAALTGAVKKNLGKEDFLKLLVTQLRNQDPMNPEDPKDFVAQLAQFSSLEQQINANDNLESLGKLFQTLKESQSMSQGVSLLGKKVTGVGNMLTMKGGQASGASYQLPLQAKEVVVGIFNSAGQLVRTLKLGSQAAGSQALTWDGKDDQGKQVPDGLYAYQVAAKDNSGNAMQVTNYFTGKVQEVYQDSQGVWVKIDGRQVLLDNVVSVGEGS